MHETARCEPDFQAAGEHFNPAGAEHGLGENGPHGGDLPNIWADDRGVARFEAIAEHFDRGGPSIVVHANADDYRTDPAGASGARIACGVIEAER